jgi:hypothetical protein
MDHQDRVLSTLEERLNRLQAAEHSILQVASYSPRLGALDRSGGAVYRSDSSFEGPKLPASPFAAPAATAAVAAVESPIVSPYVSGVEMVGGGGGDEDTCVDDMQQWLEEYRQSRPAVQMGPPEEEMWAPPPEEAESEEGGGEGARGAAAEDGQVRASPSHSPSPEGSPRPRRTLLLPVTPEAAPDFDSPLRFAAGAAPARERNESLLQAAEGAVTMGMPPLVGSRRAYKIAYIKS